MCGGYARRAPEKTVLHEVMRENLESVLEELREEAPGPPRYVETELRGYLDCGMLESGFVRCECEQCGKEILVAFSCKGKGFSRRARRGR